MKHLAKVSNSGEKKSKNKIVAYPKKTTTLEPGSRSKPSINCVNLIVYKKQ